jgi:hypothetical protein
MSINPSQVPAPARREEEEDPFDVRPAQIPGAPEGVTVRAVMMTPKVAAQWLAESRIRNRNHRDQVSDAYGRDMSEGRWKFNGEAIVRDKEGNLLQGQHRLQAVEKSRSAVLLLVIEGVESGVMDTFDTGLPRYYKDMLQVAGYSYPTSMSSITRGMWRWDRGQYMLTPSGNADRPSRAELDAYLSAHRDEIEASAAYAERLRIRVLMPASVLGTAAIILNRIDSLAAGEFFNKLAYGDDLKRDNPILVLRNQLDRRNSSSKETTDERRALLFGTWNYWRTGEVRDKIRPWRGQLTSRNYPIPR